MKVTRSPADVLNDLATRVQYDGDSEEEEYATSQNFEYNPLAFETRREAFLYETQGLIRRIARTWAPLGNPLDAPQVDAYGEPDEPYDVVLLALFPKGELVAYLVVRELRGGLGTLRLFLGVGVKAKEPQPSGGEGDEGRTWLPVARSSKLP